MAIASCPSSDTWTTFMVCTWTSYANYSALGLRNTNDNSAGIRHEIEGFPSGPTIYGRLLAISSAAGGSSASYSSGYNDIGTGNYICTFQHSPAGGQLRLNSIDLTTTTTPGTTAAQAWQLIGGGQAAYTANGQCIAELLSFNTQLSASDIASIEAYLQAKWLTPTNTVISQIHCEGTNGATTMNDYIGSFPWTFAGGATISTAQSKFGTSSLAFTGVTGQYVSRQNQNLNIYTQDFTIECWVYPTSTSAVSVFFDCRTADGTTPFLMGANTGGALRWFDGTVISGTTAFVAGTTPGTVTANVNLNAWNHVYWSRASGVNSVGLNGVEVYSWYNNFTVSNSTSAQIVLGSNATPSVAQHLTGYLDEMRFVIGKAVYAPGCGTYTVPTAAFPDAGVITTTTIFNPRYVPDLTLWYDASVSSSITKNSMNQVSQWNNLANTYELTANQNNATKTASANCYYNTADFPLGAVYFAGVDPLTIASCPTSASWTTFMVAKVSPSTGTNSLGLHNGNNNSWNLRHEFNSTAAGTAYAQGIIGTTTNAYFISTAASTNLTGFPGVHTLVVSHGSTLGTGILRLDGKALTAENILPNNFNAGTTYGAAGVSTASTSQAWTYLGGDSGYAGMGAIAEIVTYKRQLTQTEILQVEYYLQQKWGVLSRDPLYDYTGAVVHGNTSSYTADPNFSSVQMLLHMNGPSRSTTFNDVKGATWTVAGTGSQISSNMYKFGSGSYYNSGNGYISTPAASRFNFLAGAFTIECWMYMNVTGTHVFLSSTSSTSGLAYEWMWYVDNTTQMKIYYGTRGVNQSVLAMVLPATLTAGAWNHFAVSRDASGNVYGFLNGVICPSYYVAPLASSLSFSGPFTGVPNYPFNAGSTSNPLTIGGWFASANNGYIDELRYTVGVGRYTANFTPPTAPYPNFSTGSTEFIDSSPWRNPVTTVGTPISDSSVTMFGNPTMKFVAANSCGLSMAPIYRLQPFKQASGETIVSTIECWFKTTMTGMGTIMAQTDGLFANDSWTLEIGNNVAGGAGPGYLQFFQRNFSNSASLLTSPSTYNDGLWHHVAVTKGSTLAGNTGTQYTIWIDGIAVHSVVWNSGTINTSSVNFTIGYDANLIGRYFDGWIYDARVTKTNYAAGEPLYGSRYNNTNFTRIGQQFPDS